VSPMAQSTAAAAIDDGQWSKNSMSVVVHIFTLELHHSSTVFNVCNADTAAASNYITIHCRQDHLCGPGSEAPRVPPSWIHLAREEVDEGERRDRTEPPVQRRQDEELHPDDRLQVEDVTRAVYLSIRATFIRNSFSVD
jgi:hypothetical protein